MKFPVVISDAPFFFPMHSTHRLFFLRENPRDDEVSSEACTSLGTGSEQSWFHPMMVGCYVFFSWGLLWVYELLFIWVYFHNDVIFRGFPIKLLLKIPRFSSVNFQVKSPRSRTLNQKRDHTIHPQRLKKTSAVLKKMLVYFPKKLSQKWWCISQSWWLENHPGLPFWGYPFQDSGGEVSTCHTTTAWEC